MSEEEWISAAAALALLGMNYQDATRTICKRAHADLIKARAEPFIRSGQPSDNVDVPSEFWWAEGERALTQNWKTGDFETSIRDGLIRLEAFGVTFRRSYIEKMITTVETPAREAARKMTATGKTVFIGHGRAAIWRELKEFLQERLHLRVEEFNSVPVAGMTRANRYDFKILGEAYIPNGASYVYWISNKGGPEEVFEASYTVRNETCVMTEDRRIYRSFGDKDQFKEAEQYYIMEVKNRLNGE
jgi:hypothetical protein